MFYLHKENIRLYYLRYLLKHGKQQLGVPSVFVIAPQSVLVITSLRYPNHLLKFKFEPIVSSNFSIFFLFFCGFTKHCSIWTITFSSDFCKLGGFDVVPACLSSCCSGIRWRMCDVIAQCTQNNPFCQEYVVKHLFLESLLNMVDKDPDEKCRTKAFFAVSSELVEFFYCYLFYYMCIFLQRLLWCRLLVRYDHVLHA